MHDNIGIDMYRKVVTMTAWRRPEYTKRVIDNLKKCIGFEEYVLLPTIEPGNSGVLKAFHGLHNCNIIGNNKRLGCPKNTLKALKRGFELSDFVIHLEDDTVPGIDSLKYFEWVYSTYKDDKDVFTACAYSRYVHPQNYFTVWRNRWFTPWMWCTWIDRFEEIKKDWNFSGWDNRLNHKIRKNRCEIMPHLARSQNIGERLGTYNNPAHWRKKQYNPVWVNNVQNISFENPVYTESKHTEIKEPKRIKEIKVQDYVTEGYRNILKREPDPNGFKHYVSQISSGKISKERFLEILRTSKEYKNRFKKDII